jgi:hypothetical protein
MIPAIAGAFGHLLANPFERTGVEIEILK